MTNTDTMEIWCVHWLGSLGQVQSLQTISPGPSLATHAITDSLAIKPDLTPKNQFHSKASVLEEDTELLLDVSGGPSSPAQGWAFNNLPPYPSKKGE